MSNSSDTEVVVLSNYSAAESSADMIFKIAGAMNDVFDSFDKGMLDLHQNQWISRGSEEDTAVYNTHYKANFQPFYDEVVKMHDVVGDAVVTYKAADNAAQAAVAGAVGAAVGAATGAVNNVKPN